MATSLPNNPSLQRFRRDARRLQRAVRSGDPTALDLVARLHPQGVPAGPEQLPLADAQLVVARGYGFPSWPRLRHYLDAAATLRRDPDAVRPACAVDRFCALACLTYTDVDDPARWAEAESVAAAEPDLARRSVHAAAALGDAEAVRAHLAAEPTAANGEGGPFRWPPLLYLAYSRVAQQDPLRAARLLLDAGADPAAGYLWKGLPTPMTALTGCFGEGEGGPGRQPRHPHQDELARLLLDRGADPNDAQALYNRMFGRDDGHLQLLFGHGLGTGDGGVWRRRLGEATESVAEMMQRQVDWAQGHGFDDRLALLVSQGFGPGPARGRVTSVHRAGSPEAVREAVADGADVDAYEQGRTALHHYAWAGDAPMVEALLAAGADPDLLDAEYGTTPLGWAEYGRQRETAALLRAVTAPG